MNKINKIIFSILVLINFNLNLMADTNNTNEFNATKILNKDCKIIYKDYLFFVKKSMKTRGSMSKRWKIISEEYKKEYKKCISSRNHEQTFFTPNPLNEATK